MGNTLKLNAKHCIKNTLLIGLNHKPKRNDALLSIGEKDCDINFPGVGDRLCSFRIHGRSGDIIFHRDHVDKNVLIIAKGPKYGLQGQSPRRVLLWGEPYRLFLRNAVFDVVWCQQSEHSDITKILSFKQIPTPAFEGPGEGGKIVYHALEQLGEGACACAHEVVDLASGEHLALKEVKKDDHEKTGLLEKEWDLWKRLQNVCLFSICGH